jgi:hypothetical protein
MEQPNEGGWVGRNSYVTKKGGVGKHPLFISFYYRYIEPASASSILVVFIVIPTLGNNPPRASYKPLKRIDIAVRYNIIIKRWLKEATLIVTYV